MVSNFRSLSGLIRDESGQDVLEYGLVAAFIGFGAIAAMKNLATSVKGVFNGLSNVFNAAV